MKKLKGHKVDWAQIERFLQSAEKKLASAHKILTFDDEACLQQAYEAMLKASLGFMFSYGLRVRSQPGHHIAIILRVIRGDIAVRRSLIRSALDGASATQWFGSELGMTAGNEN